MIARHILSELDSMGEEGYPIQRRIVTELCKLRNVPDDKVEDKDAALNALRYLKELALAQKLVVEENRSVAEQKAQEARRRQAALAEQAQKSLPDGMSMGLTYFLGPHSHIVGPALEVRTDLQSWRWVMEVAHAPLAILFVLASSHPGDHFFSLGGFTAEHWRRRSPVEGDMEIGFGHLPYPGDYRTQADLAAG